LQLQRLTGMERQKILDELAEIHARIAEYMEILVREGSCARHRQRIARSTEGDFGDARRTEIIEDHRRDHIEDLVEGRGSCRHRHARRVPQAHSGDTYRRQSRGGGKGRIGMGTLTEDVVEHLIIASTHSYVLIFTDKGRVYWLKIYEIPDAGTAGKGKNISCLIKPAAPTSR
jgi:DNA gyrase subunit A